MSTKAKSKNASAPSPDPGVPGTPSEVSPVAAGRKDVVTVYLLSDRARRASWMLGGLVIGALLLSTFGTVAAAAGGILIALGLYHTWFFMRTLRHRAGAVTIDSRTISLPTGLCHRQPSPMAAETLAAAYFLRSAVPWNRSAPVLVIEAGGRAFMYPRDWFASEADQRRIMHALLPIVAANGGAASSAVK